MQVLKAVKFLEGIIREKKLFNNSPGDILGFDKAVATKTKLSKWNTIKLKKQSLFWVYIKEIIFKETSALSFFTATLKRGNIWKQPKYLSMDKGKKIYIIYYIEYI